MNLNAAVNTNYMKKFVFLFIWILYLYGCDKTSNVNNSASVSSTGQGGSMARFTIVGNYLYTVDIQDLKVFDLSNVAQPVFKRLVPVGFDIETIYPFKDKLFIGSGSEVYIFSIEDPSNPK